MRLKAACLDGGTKKVHLRLAENEGKIYIDLGDEQRRCVEVSADGWSVKLKAPVYFRRDETSRPLPVPKSGGNATAHFDCVNLPDRAQQILVLS